MKIMIEISKEDYEYLKDAYESGDWSDRELPRWTVPNFYFMMVQYFKDMAG